MLPETKYLSYRAKNEAKLGWEKSEQKATWIHFATQAVVLVSPKYSSGCSAFPEIPMKQQHVLDS